MNKLNYGSAREREKYSRKVLRMRKRIRSLNISKREQQFILDYMDYISDRFEYLGRQQVYRELKSMQDHLNFLIGACDE